MNKVIEVKDLKRNYITTKGFFLRKKSTLIAVEGAMYMEYAGILLIELLVLTLFTVGLYHWMDKRIRIHATLEVS